MEKEYDIAVVGGGLIGCSIAWRLGQAGKKVVVIDRGDLGREASWAAGGMLAPFAEANQASAFLNLAMTSRGLYSGFAQELREITGVDIEYRTDGTLYLALSDEDEKELDQRWRWQEAAGLNVEKLSAIEALKLEPALNPDVRWALQFSGDHQVDNRKMMQALELACGKSGVDLRPKTEAQKILSNNAQVEGVETNRGRILAETVVLATGCWTKIIQPGVPVEPVRGQMLSLKVPESLVRHVVYSTQGYLIPRLSGELIAGSTTENTGYQKAVTAEGIHKILNHAFDIMPSLKNFEVIETWSGLRPRSMDELPILGRHPRIDGLIYATGHYRNGVLLTPITAEIIGQLILDGQSEIDLRPFEISRFDQTAISA